MPASLAQLSSVACLACMDGLAGQLPRSTSTLPHRSLRTSLHHPSSPAVNRLQHPSPPSSPAEASQHQVDIASRPAPAQNANSRSPRSPQPLHVLLCSDSLLRSRLPSQQLELIKHQSRLSPASVCSRSGDLHTTPTQAEERHTRITDHVFALGPHHPSFRPSRRIHPRRRHQRHDRPRSHRRQLRAGQVGEPAGDIQRRRVSPLRSREAADDCDVVGLDQVHRSRLIRLSNTVHCAPRAAAR